MASATASSRRISPTRASNTRRVVRKTLAGLVGGALATAALVGVPLFAPVEQAAAAPGTPGTPDEPTVLFEEDFQNVPSLNPILSLPDYTGATGNRFTADDPWLRDCNGWLVNFNQDPNPATQVADCRGRQGSWNSLQQLAWGVGAYRDMPDPSQNYLVAALTNAPPGADLIEFATVTPISLPAATGRYVAFSVDVAAGSCQVSRPALQFQFIDAQNTRTDIGGPVDGCGTTLTEPVPAKGVNPARQDFFITTAVSDGSIQLEGGSFTVEMRNANGSGSGNDHAFDNFRVLDVTPQLDKQFTDSTIVLGQQTTLTFTITNTSELGAKEGWAFVDDLPAGMTVAGAAQTTCTNGTVTAAAGSAQVRVAGDLNDGQASCTATVPVTVDSVGAFTNGPDNVTPDGVNPPGSTTVTVVAPNPELTLDKSSSDASFATIGDVVDYTFLVTNTGNVTVTDVAITDDQIDAPAVCPVTTLAPQASTTCTGAHIVTQADVDAGSVVNVATAGGTGPGGAPVVSAEDTVTVPGPAAAPALTLEKASTDASYAAVGDVVDYTFLVTNTGNVTVTGVAITDDQIDAPAVCPVTTLAPAGTTTCTGSHTVTQADVDAGSVVNVATAAGTDPSGAPVESAEDTVTVPGPAAAPALTLEKASTDASFAAVGDVVDYTFLVTNTGNVTVTGVAITDDQIDAPAVCPVSTLAPAASTTCSGSHTVTQAEVDAGEIVNVATAAGTDPAGTPVVSAEDTVTVPGPPPAPALSLDKASTDASFAAVGDIVDYTFLVTNTGNVTVTGVAITDDQIDAPAVCPVTTLAPAASTTCTGSHTVTQAEVDAGEIVNVATAAGTDPGGDPVVSAEDTVTVPGPASAPALTLEKASDDASFAAVGDVVDYTFLVTNTGNVTVSDVAITDDQIDAPAVCPVTTLAPAASTTCSGSHTVTQADVDGGEIVNVATAAGTDPAGTPVVSAEDTVTVPGPPPAPALSLDKASPDVAYAAVGDEVDYTFVVTNTGNVTVTEVAVQDDTVDAAVVCPVTTLAPAASTTCTGVHTVTQDDIDAGAVVNVAVATGLDPDGTPVESPEDAVTVPGPTAVPSLSLDKRVTETTFAAAGDVLHYEFVVTNTGIVTVRDVVVNDAKLDAAAVCPETTLAPAQSATCTGVHTVTAADVADGRVVNVASASGTDPSGGRVTSPTDSATVQGTPPVALAVTGGGLAIGAVVAAVLLLAAGGGLLLVTARRRRV